MNRNELKQQLEVAQRQLDALLEPGFASTPDRSQWVAMLTSVSAALQNLQTLFPTLDEQDKALDAYHRTIALEHQRYQELLESVVEGYIITDDRGFIQEANRSAADLINVNLKTMAGEQLADFLPDHARSAFERMLTQVQHYDVAEPIELRMSFHPNYVTHLVLAVEPICLWDDRNEATGLRWRLRDITTLKRAEIVLQKQSKRHAQLEQEVKERTRQVQKALDFESMLKRITDKVRDSLDESQILQAVVQELTIVLGLAGCNSALYDLDQGTSTISYEYTSSIPAFQGRVAQMDHSPEIYRQLKQGYSFQFCSLFPNPMRGSVAMLACPIFVDPNSSQGVDQAVLGDLWLIHHQEYEFTEFEVRLVEQVANQCAIAIRQARLYQAAQVQVQELEKLNRLKDEFLSTISHELRTPITNVNMAIRMLKVAPDDERRQRYLKILETEALREAELIDELLDLQRLEAGKQPIASTTLQLSDWLPSVMEPFYSRAANYRQALRLHCPQELPPFATDFDILQRVLCELLNNACKYTPAGNEILLKVQHEEHDSGDLPQREPVNYLSFLVQNQADIPKAELPHIFDKFYRVIQVDRYKQGGTGLGLALVLKRVEQLQGTIQVESTEGWTTFRVTIPHLEERER